MVQRFVEFAQTRLGQAPVGHLRQQGAVRDFQRAPFAVQLDKDGDLGTQHRGVHRLVQVVHRAATVAFQDVLVFVVVGSHMVTGPGVEALLTVALHRLRRQRQDLPRPGLRCVAFVTRCENQVHWISGAVAPVQDG